ncbi:laminin subunit beta-2-like [Corticium candelabrum]|uniref:laminin subunit beta-2-like n=1 Tax=Corticium candelabrum TaxID=121492 RepID=UPI002E268DCF|nr:laminin subunit beta-2-like [Corticium candelabrum]
MLAAACNCDAAGRTSSQCNSTGYCDCKTNVGGKQCDQCLTGFFNLQATNVDGCDDCECDSTGSDPSFNGACNSTGYCNCKPNVVGKKCDQCEVGFYLLAGLNGCIECGCSLSTATSLQCHMQTGQCPCKSGLTGRTCGVIADFHWLPFLEGLIYEAESAWLSGGAMVERRVSDLSKFTGTGGVRMSGNGNRITFRVIVPQRSIQYRLIIRYEAPSSVDSVVLTAMRSGDGASVLADEGILPSAPTFANPHERPLIGQQIAGSELIVNFTYNLNAGAGNPVDGFFVDSLLLMPLHTDLPEFQALSFGDQLVFPFTCNDVRESVPQSSSASLTEFCRNITILINAALFNGALDCSCDNVGTLGSSQLCEKLGGQCNCASNIVTRTCSACDYTYFGFDSAGCEACMCNVIGSNSPQCNETGYCDCKGNAGGQRCDICKSTFFNFTSSNSDICEGNFIAHSKLARADIFACQL